MSSPGNDKRQNKIIHKLHDRHQGIKSLIQGLSKRPVIIKLFLVIILIPIGLLTKFYNGIGSEFVVNYFGGVIYVVFFILLAALVFPKADPLKISLIIFCITCLIEFSQLIQNDFLNNLRTNFIIRSFIGSVFNFLDLVFYAVGTATGYVIIVCLNRKST